MRERGNRLVQYIPDYTVFDLETTGISAHTDDIIEISAVKVKGGIVQNTFSTLVNSWETHSGTGYESKWNYRSNGVRSATDPRSNDGVFAFCRRGYSGGT